MDSVSRLPWIVVGASAIALGTALASQYVGGLQPCVLCIYQRWPYAIAAVLGLLAIFVRDAKLRAVLLGLAALAFLVDAGIAGFHVGVEHKWWEGTAECGTSFATPNSLEALRAALANAPVVDCSKPAWSFAGISMAGFNAAAALILAIITAVGLGRARNAAD